MTSLSPLAGAAVVGQENLVSINPLLGAPPTLLVQPGAPSLDNTTSSDLLLYAALRPIPSYGGASLAAPLLKSTPGVEHSGEYI